MITSDAMKKIRKVQIVSSRLAGDLFAGHYRSAFKGRGLEFGELREYEAGDDIRFMDWNVTARTGRPHVKKFIEERELTVLLLLDISASLSFGTVKGFKNQLAAEICSLLCCTSLINNDKVGLLLFTDRIEKYIPPRKGSRQALRIIKESLYFQPEGTGTNIAEAIHFAGRVFQHRVIIFLLSDLYAPDFEKPLAVISKKHDIIVITINDPAEFDLPDAGILQFQDAESGERWLIDSGDAKIRDACRKDNIARRDDRRRRLLTTGVDFVDIFTDKPYMAPLIALFKERERRLHSLQ